MDAKKTSRSNHQIILAEIVEGLREYQQILVDSAGKVSDGNMAMRLYDVANKHGALEMQLRKLAQAELADDTPLATPFLNQIRALGQRLREFGDPSHSRYVMCEIIQTEERMIRRFRALIDQVGDISWRKQLSTHLYQMLEVRESLSRLRNNPPQERGRNPMQRPRSTASSEVIRRN